MNTPVSFPIAKLLKEKGFVCHKSDKFWRDGFSLEKKDYNPIAYQDKDNVATIAEVVMWLYEKYEIWITVGADSIFHKGKHHILIYKNNGNGLELSPIEKTLHGPYDSPTEAYSSAIEYTLTNLI